MKHVMADGEVEGPVGKGNSLGVAQREANAVTDSLLARVLFREGQHASGKVDGVDRKGWIELRYSDGDPSRAGAHVEHPSACHAHVHRGLREALEEDRSEEPLELI